MPPPPHGDSPTGTIARPTRAQRVRREAGVSVDRPRAASPSTTVDGSAASPRGTYARFGRPLFNLALITALLPFLALLALPIALANWISFGDPRRILFVQPRVGHRGRVFQIYKFRTMREHAGGAHQSWTSGTDGLRVTRFGRFLRNTHLDELPQALNILKRDMDVIGPRPEMVEIERWASEHIEGFGDRLAIRPGITGIAQITQGYTGHDLEAYAQKLEINRRYLANMSLALDLEIVARTALWMLRGKGWDWQGPRGGTKRAR